MENAKELVAKFEERMNTKVRRKEKLDIAKEKDFRRGELPGKHTARMLCGWDDGKFENKYLKRLERNWNKWKGGDRMRWKNKVRSFFRSKNLEGKVMSDMQSLDSSFFI